jgi:hypothetical protein
MIHKTSPFDDVSGWLGSHTRLMGCHLRYEEGLGLISNRPVRCQTSSVIVLIAYSSNASRVSSPRKSASSSTQVSNLTENLTSNVKLDN